MQKKSLYSIWYGNEDNLRVVVACFSTTTCAAYCYHCPKDIPDLIGISEWYITMRYHAK